MIIFPLIKGQRLWKTHPCYLLSSKYQADTNSNMMGENGRYLVAKGDSAGANKDEYTCKWRIIGLRVVRTRVHAHFFWFNKSLSWFCSVLLHVKHGDGIKIHIELKECSKSQTSVHYWLECWSKDNHLLHMSQTHHKVNAWLEYYAVVRSIIASSQVIMLVSTITLRNHLSPYRHYWQWLSDSGIYP